LLQAIQKPCIVFYKPQDRKKTGEKEIFYITDTQLLTEHVCIGTAQKFEDTSNFTDLLPSSGHRPVPDRY
jgi:hypothetical protein